MSQTEQREYVHFRSDGQQIFGIIHRPLNLQTYPAVLICHGLAGTKVGYRRLYVKIAEQLAESGIAALRFDFRGCGDSEGSFEDMTISTEVEDASRALEFLRNDPHIDSQRIGMFGRSFGGLISVLAAKHHPQLKCLVLWAPVFNGDQWREKWELMQKARLPAKESKKLMAVNGMTPGINFFKELFTLNIHPALNDIKSLPLLHIHGEKDEMVTVQHASEYRENLNPLNEMAKFLTLPNSDHDFSDEEERNFAIYESVQWLQTHLNNNVKAS